jgi:hypothetical protein
MSRASPSRRPAGGPVLPSESAHAVRA